MTYLGSCCAFSMISPSHGYHLKIQTPKMLKATQNKRNHPITNLLPLHSPGNTTPCSLATR